MQLELVTIPSGSFLMGSPPHEAGRTPNEEPLHTVHIQSFLMGKFSVTQLQWREVAELPKIKIDLEPDPSFCKGENRPVEQISWYEAVEFCDRLSSQTKRSYRLPSEAEWEYACRAGSVTPFHFGEILTADLANYRGCPNYLLDSEGIYHATTTEVGAFPCNAFGLYDMHGNVWEWCADQWFENYQNASLDGKALGAEANDAVRVLRGGSWLDKTIDCRSAKRDWCEPDKWDNNIGLRIVCEIT